MSHTQLEVDVGLDFEKNTKKICPLSIASGLIYHCSKEECGWYVTDDGREECAIVKLAKGWCM